jgi:hypothetical protein
MAITAATPHRKRSPATPRRRIRRGSPAMRWRRRSSDDPSRVHHAARRRGGGVAAGSARAAAGDAGGGFLSSRSPGESAGVVAAFRQGLGETGFAEGQNLAIAFRWAEGHYDRLPALAAELVNLRVAAASGHAAAPPSSVMLPGQFAHCERTPAYVGLLFECNCSKLNNGLTCIFWTTTCFFGQPFTCLCFGIEIRASKGAMP